MITTPTDSAKHLALELGRVLELIHDHFAPTADRAYRLALSRDFGLARQHMADANHLADATERATAMLPDVRPAVGGLSSRARFSDNVCGAIFELAQTAEIDAVLDGTDPERLAQAGRIAELRFGGGTAVTR